MKAVRLLSSLSILILLCFFTSTAVNAAIVWDTVRFNHQVEQNNLTIYNIDDDPISPAAELEADEEQKTHDDSPINSRVDSTTPNDPTGLGAQAKGGTGSQILSNGARLDAYAQATTGFSNPDVPDPYAIEVSQTSVVSFVAREFHVTSNQMATLSGMAQGQIDNPNIASGPLRAIYEVTEGSIELIELVEQQGLSVPLGSTTFEFEDLLNNGSKNEQVSLITEKDGDPVKYQLVAKFNLETLLNNYNGFMEDRVGDIDVGSLGTDLNPLVLEVTLEPNAVPLPGTLLLLLSGIPAVIGLRKRFI